MPPRCPAAKRPWRKNFGNGFQAGATYSFGRDSVNAGPSPAGTNCPGQTTPDSDLWHLGASMPVSPALTLSGQVVSLRYKNASDYNATLMALRATYAFSKRTNVFAQVGHIKNNKASAVALSGGSPGSNPVAGASQTGLNIGFQTAF